MPTPLEETQRQGANLLAAYNQAVQEGRRPPKTFLLMAQTMQRATVAIARLLSSLLAARGRLLLANPNADTRSIDALLASGGGQELTEESVFSAEGPSDVIIDYTNWRGVRGLRRIRPLRLWWGGTQYHPGHQFLLTALDVEKGEERDFAMADIHGWQAAPAASGKEHGPA